jgi:2-aminoadipate transaminase
VSYYDNPAAVTLSLERRPQIVEIAERFSRRVGHRIRVIEDAAYRELRYAGEDLPSLRAFDPQGDTVIVAQTFSKSFSPGIRVGWGFLPRDLVQPVCDVKGVVDFGSPNFAQHVMAQVLESGKYEPHVRTLRDAYHTKLNAMLKAADEHLASIPGVHYLRPTGGLYVWLTLPAHIDTSLRGPLFNLAMEEGMLYVPGEYCYPAGDLDGRSAPQNTIRLSFGVQSPERIALGMAALGRAIRRLPA